MKRSIMKMGVLIAFAASMAVSLPAWAFYSQTVCTPETGECHEVVVTSGDWSAAGSYRCSLDYSSTSACGLYHDYMSWNGNSTTDVDLSTDTWMNALFSGYYNADRGFTLTCEVTTGITANGDGIAQCMMTQGPNTWFCTARKGEDISTEHCCREGECDY